MAPARDKGGRASLPMINSDFGIYKYLGKLSGKWWGPYAVVLLTLLIVIGLALLPKPG